LPREDDVHNHGSAPACIKAGINLSPGASFVAVLDMREQLLDRRFPFEATAKNAERIRMSHRKMGSGPNFVKVWAAVSSGR
jgi:hypothetical protein